MKITILLIQLVLFATINCKAQSQDRILDSLESSFERIARNVKMSCDWEMEGKFKENGHLFFINKEDSTQLEFTFFKAKTLPFYNPKQTDFEITSEYYNWELRETNSLKSINLTQIEQNKDDGFLIFSIKDSSGEIYRLLANKLGITYSIKIFNKEMTVENQLDLLRNLYYLNKD